MQDEQYNVLLALVKLIEEKKPKNCAAAIREAIDFFRAELTESQLIGIERQFYFGRRTFGSHGETD